MGPGELLAGWATATVLDLIAAISGSAIAAANSPGLITSLQLAVVLVEYWLCFILFKATDMGD